jgi:aryl-alcohol dehydrogenase-like predicted oxidoreductase
MKYGKLGHSGLIVSAVGLGSMQFGTRMNMGNLAQEVRIPVLHPEWYEKGEPWPDLMKSSAH